MHDITSCSIYQVQIEMSERCPEAVVHHWSSLKDTVRSCMDAGCIATSSSMKRGRSRSPFPPSADAHAELVSTGSPHANPGRSNSRRTIRPSRWDSTHPSDGSKKNPLQVLVAPVSPFDRTTAKSSSGTSWQAQGAAATGRLLLAPQPLANLILESTADWVRVVSHLMNTTCYEPYNAIVGLRF